VDRKLPMRTHGRGKPRPYVICAAVAAADEKQPLKRGESSETDPTAPTKITVRCNASGLPGAMKERILIDIVHHWKQGRAKKNPATATNSPAAIRRL